MHCPEQHSIFSSLNLGINIYTTNILYVPGTCYDKKTLLNSPGHNQIWICNFLQSDWRRAQPKHWLDRERTKLDRNVEQGNFEANSCRVLWVECALKKSNSDTEPINRDYFMRHSVRFTNIAFCKHPWISDNISRDQKQLDDSDRIGRIGNLNTAIHR